MSISQEYHGQVALITGAARGIGLRIAKHLAEAGAQVLIADLNTTEGTTSAQNLRADGLNADFLQADLSQTGGAAAMIATALQQTGKIDILINNARAGKRLSLFDETEENWTLAHDVGLKAAFFASQGVIKHMSARGGCRIVNIASVAALHVTIEAPSYHSSKAALAHLTKYLAVAGGPHQARVNAIVPGLIVQDEHRPRFDSPENATYKELAQTYQPLGEVGSEQDVAEAVRYLCSNRARYISGTCLVLDGAATAQEPFGLMLKKKP